VASQALGGEVLVSNLVRELVAGSGVDFLESREVELKGLDGSHRLFAVDLS
jgi:class 3 adenylate cyclase